MNIETFNTNAGFNLSARAGSFFARALRERGGWAPIETELVKTLVKLGDLTVDVGCHVGWFSCVMAKQGASVVALDPNREVAKIAFSNFLGLPICLIEAAALDVVGEVPFFMPSLYEDGWGSIASTFGDDRSSPTMVEAVRLCDVLPNGKIRLVKIDTEGSELQVLKGLGGRVADVENFLVECFDRPKRVSFSGSSTAAINDFLVPAGFVPNEYRAGKWQRVPRAVSREEHDVWFSRTA
jgi:FkbM family methyltransferase